MTDETPGSSGQGHDAEWRSWLLSNAAEFSQAVGDYQAELDHQIQTAEIHLGLRFGCMRPKVRCGPSHQLLIESILSLDLELAAVGRKIEIALGRGAIAGARKLSKKIGLELASRIAI